MIQNVSVRCQGIHKSYKDFLGPRNIALKNINLEIGSDEIFGLLGPNGSGKTTLISILSTLIYPDKGSLAILGLEAESNKDLIRNRINICTAKPNFPWSLTVKENLHHYGMLYGMHGSVLARAVNDQIEAFGLEEYRDMKFEDLSTGLKQRLSLAKSMLNRPRLLFLDEPTTGLDPDMSMKTRLLIKKIHEENGVSVVLSTHYMPEAEMLCDRIAFLRKGEIVALDTPRNLKNHLGLGERVIIFFEGSLDIEKLREIPGILSISSEPGRVEILINRNNENLDRIIKFFSTTRIIDIEIKEPDLEDVFLELAG